MDLAEPIIPLSEGATQAGLAVALHFKMVAALHSIGKLNDEEATKVAQALIAELPGVQARFDAWGMLEAMIPDFKRPEEEQPEKADD